LMNYNKEILYKDPRIGDVRRHLADISLVKTLGWEPKIDFPEGIRKTVEWYLNNKEVFQ